jgi:tRNA pseudouridine13 synthase
MGELERQVLAEECVEAQGFQVAAMPEVGARGELRAAVCPVKKPTAGAVSEDSDGSLQVSLDFMLLRGAYATVLLREIMKPTDLIVAGF